MPQVVHFDLDGAWPPDTTPPGTHIDCREWGPRLRYSTNAREMNAFHEAIRAKTAPFTLFGSGDFHHLSALWIRSVAGPFTLVSFDNHPDWDIRPPRWCCGTWINRALELPQVRGVAIWGCGNFELNWPGCLFVNRRALDAGRLNVWPWTERLKPSGRRRWPGIVRDDWRAKFAEFARTLANHNVYVTVDLDCLDVSESATNWEQGLFTADDIAWALAQIRTHTAIVGGDLCGARSEPHYARRTQRFAANLDHPRLPAANAAESAAQNARAFHKIWPALTDGHNRNANANQQHANP